MFTIEKPTSATVHSRDQGPFRASGLGLFIHNQFRTTIPLPTMETYPNIADKVAIITGANSGMGLEACRQLVSLGLSRLIMTVRTFDKGTQAAEDLRAAIPIGQATRIDVWQLDMDSYESVQAFARRCETELTRLDLAILNAGTSHVQFSTLPTTGHEPTIQTNHISTSLLAILLLPILRDRAPIKTPGRLVVVSSLTAHLNDFPLRDHRPLLRTFDASESWLGDRYAQSKLINQLFLARLATLVDADKVTMTLVEPGLVRGTGLFRRVPWLLRIVLNLLGRPASQGAAAYLNAALGWGTEAHGAYLMNLEMAPYCHWYYDDADGTRYTDAIWKETLEELRFAGVEDIVAAMK